MSDIPTIRIGIIGAGFLAETRAQCYRQVAGVRPEIVAVAALGLESARAFAKKHDVPHYSAGDAELLALPEVDVVDLCVPNLVHRKLAEAAARAGKHIICTKPLTAYVGQDLAPDVSDEEVSAVAPARMLEVAVADARAMVDSARDAGVLLMYAENWIYAPSICRARKLLAAAGGSILEMRGWESHNGSHSPYSKLWRHTGGGALLRLGAHPIGAMLLLKREEGLAKNGRPIRPVAVTADVADLTRVAGLDPKSCHIVTGWKDVENWGCAVIVFEDGSRGTVYGSDNQLGGMESKLEIYASDCHLKCNMSPNDLLRAYAPTDEVFGDEYLMEKLDTRAGWSTPMPSEVWSNGQLPMIEAFLNAVAHGHPVESDGELGLEVTRVVYAAYLAAHEGRRVELN